MGMTNSVEITSKKFESYDDMIAFLFYLIPTRIHPLLYKWVMNCERY